MGKRDGTKDETREEIGPGDKATPKESPEETDSGGDPCIPEE